MPPVTQPDFASLQHAFGPAGDLPPLLEQVAKAKGKAFEQALGEVWNRVNHQGTIYSASAFPLTQTPLEICGLLRRQLNSAAGDAGIDRCFQVDSARRRNR